MDLNNQIETFEKQAQDYKKELYSKLKPSQKLQEAIVKVAMSLMTANRKPFAQTVLPACLS